MLIENVLNLYGKEIKKKRARKLTNTEIGIVAAMLIAFYIAVYSIGYFQLHEKVKCALITWLIFLLVEIGLIVISEYLVKKRFDDRLDLYNDFLDKLENMLDNEGYYTESHMNIIMDWCDQYSSSESFWIKMFKPVSIFVTACIIPIITVILQDLYSAINADKISVIFLAILVGGVFYALAYGIIPVIQDNLNKNHILAGNLKTDLVQLKFRNLLKSKISQ